MLYECVHLSCSWLPSKYASTCVPWISRSQAPTTPKRRLYSYTEYGRAPELKGSTDASQRRLKGHSVKRDPAPNPEGLSAHNSMKLRTGKSSSAVADGLHYSPTSPQQTLQFARGRIANWKERTATHNACYTAIHLRNGAPSLFRPRRSS